MPQLIARRWLAALATSTLLSASFIALEAHAAPSVSPSRSAGSKSMADQRLLAQRERVAQATVTLPAKSCAGSVVERANWVLTAAHCVPEGTRRLDVLLRDGRRVVASVEHLDRAADMALLELEQAAPVQPLKLASELPNARDRVLFVGRVDRKSKTQVARVTHLGQCPSLPDVQDAVFTTLRAIPGDSGAPILNEQLEIVGLIHGGAACHIAAPTAHLKHQLGDSGLAAEAPAVPAPPSTAPPGEEESEPEASSPTGTRRLGPLTFQKTPGGFRFRFDFNWQVGR